MPYPVAACRGKIFGTHVLPFADTFDRSDGAIGDPWTNQINSLVINTNSAVGGLHLNDNVATFDAGQPNVTLQANITYENPSSSYVGLVGRFQDANNYWRAVISTNGNGFHIEEINGGVMTVRAFSNTLPVVGNTYLLEAVFTGTTIRATFQSVTIEYTSATLNQNGTLFGMYAYYSRDATGVRDRLLDFFAWGGDGPRPADSDIMPVVLSNIFDYQVVQQ